MYEQYWNLTRPPFADTHEGCDYVDSPGMQLAMTKLLHITSRGGSACVITGKAGLGKTTLAREFRRKTSSSGTATSYIANPLSGVAQVLLRIARDLTGSAEAKGADLSDIMYGFARSSRNACVFIDEAHAINEIELLESLRMLMNIEHAGHKPLSIIFIGQPGIRSALSLASSFDMRLSLSITLKPMSEDETKHYILSRLKSADCSRGVFTKSAAEMICELSGGSPLTINRICELCLLVGFGFGLQKVRQDVVAMVAAELGLYNETFLSEREAELTAVAREFEAEKIIKAEQLTDISPTDIPSAFQHIEVEPDIPFETHYAGNTDIIRAASAASHPEEVPQPTVDGGADNTSTDSGSPVRGNTDILAAIGITDTENIPENDSDILSSLASTTHEESAPKGASEDATPENNSATDILGSLER